MKNKIQLIAIIVILLPILLSGCGMIDVAERTITTIGDAFFNGITNEYYSDYNVNVKYGGLLKDGYHYEVSGKLILIYDKAENIALFQSKWGYVKRYDNVIRYGFDRKNFYLQTENKYVVYEVEKWDYYKTVSEYNEVSDSFDDIYIYELTELLPDDFEAYYGNTEPYWIYVK